MMLVTFGTNVFNRPFNRVVGYVIVPFEQGIAKAGEWLSNRSDELVQIRTLLAENSALKEQVASLTEENTLLQQDKYELNELRGYWSWMRNTEIIIRSEPGSSAEIPATGILPLLLIRDPMTDWLTI